MAVSTSTTATIRGISYSKGDSFKCAKAAKGNAGSEGNGDAAKELTAGTTYYFQKKATGDAVKYPYAIATSSSGGVQGWYKEEIFPYATYSIKYNANGGSGAPGNQTKTYGTALTLSSTKPTKSSTSATGYKVSFNVNGGSGTVSALTSSKTTTYTFSKWNTKSDGSGTNYKAGGSYTANAAATLYAQYTSSTSNGSITLPAAPTRSGYTFNGWYTAASGGSKAGAAGASYTPTAATTLYAQWTEKPKQTYTLTYNSNGTGVSNMPSNQTKTQGVDLTISSKIPTRSGYTFSHWNTVSDGSGYAKHPTKTSVTYNGTTKNCNNYIESDSNLTLYAIWEIVDTTVTYTISYNYASGKKGTYAPTSGTVGQYVRISNPSRSGYTFAGWSISGMNPSTSKPCYYGSSQTDSSNTKKTSGTTLSGVKVEYYKNLRNTSGTVTFTATWTENPATTYTISYDYDGGVKGTYAPTSAAVGSYVQISNPTRSGGYTFAGWSISGLSVSQASPAYHGTTQTDRSNTKVTTGTTLSGVKSTYFKNLRSSSGTVTFKATWTSTGGGGDTSTTYTIAYSLAGGKAGNSAPTSGTVGSYVNISNPTRSGYTFAGWNITNMNPTSSQKCYYGNYQYDMSNQNTTATSLSGVKSTYYKNLRTSAGTVTFTATWESDPGGGTTTSYTISYNYDGGQKGIYAPTSANVGSYVQISNPTKSGYTFKGWSISGLSVSYTSPAYHGTTQTDSSNTRVTTGTTLSGITSTYFKNLRNSSGTVTFKATWEAVPVEDNEYSISYSLGTGATAGSPAPTSGTKGTYINIGNPTRNNYEFNGWNITGLDSGTHYHGNSKPMWGDTGATSVTGTSISGVKSTWFKLQATGTVTFTATWTYTGGSGGDTTISYTIKYNYDGGQKGTYAPTSADVGEYVQISNPSKSGGYTFKGWNITGMNPTSTNRCYYGNYTTDTSNQSTTATSLSGITATRFKNLRTSAGTVTFTAVWESNASQDQELTGLILRPTSDTTLGHSCSSGTAGYSMISETTSDDDTTYIYQQITETTDQTATSTFKLSATMPSGQFKITGATIKVRGKSDSNGTYSGTYKLSTDTSASAITLNATAYESTFNSNVCSSLIGNTYTSSTFPAISVTITTTGRATSTGTKTSGQTAEIHITQVYLQLEYEAVVDNTYDIVYSLNGGNKGNPAPSTGTKGTYVNIANPTRSGYTFTGWNITGLDSGTHYHGNSRPTFGNTGATSATGTSINGVKSTWFSLQATKTVTFTATWEIIETDEELTGLILRPVSDTTLGHSCSSGTAGYSMISETTSDDNATYIFQQITETTDQTATSTFKLGGTLPTGAFKITGATIKVRGKSDSNGTYSGTYKLSTDSAASNITLNATSYTSTTNSNVGNSLIGNIYTKNNFPEISVTITTTGRVTSTGTKTGGQTAPEIRITQVYLQLEYEPIVGLAKVYTQNAWHNALSYVFINGAWKMVQAQARKNSNWKPGQGS